MSSSDSGKVTAAPIKRDPKLDLKIEHYATWLSELVTFLQQRRDQFLERVKERRRQRFCWWKRIVWGTALLRIICCLTILIMVARFRYNIMGYLLDKSWIPAASQALVSFLVYGGIVAMIALSCFVIIFDVFLCFVAQSQHPQPVALIFAIAQLFAFLLICVGCFSGGAAMNSDKISAFLFGESILRQSHPLQQANLHRHQRKHECCGGNGPSDWLHVVFYTFNDPASYNKWTVHNNMDWMAGCSKYVSNAKWPSYCAVPPACCAELVSGCTGQAKRKDYLDMIEAGKVYDQNKSLQLEPQFIMDTSAIHTRGCYPVLTEELNRTLLVVGIMIFLLCLISIFMTLLMTAVILYHSSLGKVDFRNFIVAPATGTALVRFFMWLDGMIESADTITDFSIIEELKRFDVDDGFGEHDLIEEQENSA